MKTFQIKKLINRVTKISQPNNDNFTYYGNEVTLQSGTPDYVVVSVKTEKENVYTRLCSSVSQDRKRKRLGI